MGHLIYDKQGNMLSVKKHSSKFHAYIWTKILVGDEYLGELNKIVKFYNDSDPLRIFLIRYCITFLLSEYDGAYVQKPLFLLQEWFLRVAVKSFVRGIDFDFFENPLDITIESIYNDVRKMLKNLSDAQRTVLIKSFKGENL